MKVGKGHFIVELCLHSHALWPPLAELDLSILYNELPPVLYNGTTSNSKQQAASYAKGMCRLQCILAFHIGKHLSPHNPKMFLESCV